MRNLTGLIRPGGNTMSQRDVNPAIIDAQQQVVPSIQRRGDHGNIRNNGVAEEICSQTNRSAERARC